MKTKLAALFLAFAAFLAITFASEAAKAEAEVSVKAQSCSITFYDGSNYTRPSGGQGSLTTGIRWAYINLSNYNYANRPSSLRNGACWVEVYSGPNGSGAHRPIAPWESLPFLGDWNNQIESLYIF